MYLFQTWNSSDVFSLETKIWARQEGQRPQTRDLVWKVSCTFLLSNKLENLNKFLAPYLWMDEPIRSIISYEARMWHQRCHTRVRRGGTRRRVEDAAAPPSRHVDSMYFSPTCADASQRGSDTGRFAQNRADSGLNWPKSAVSASSGRNY